MALRGGGAVWASMNDHAYLYANTLDKSIMYDLVVQRLAISGGGSLFAPAPSHQAYACSCPSPRPPNSEFSKFKVSSFRSRNLPLWGSSALSHTLLQLRLCPFLKLSTLLIDQIFIEHLLLYLCLSLSTSIYIHVENKSLYSTYYVPKLFLSALHIL